MHWKCCAINSCTFCILILTINCNLIKVTNAKEEFYSSIAGLEKLLKTEIVLLKELTNYVDNLNIYIEGLKSEIKTIKTEHVAASKDSDGYLNNPVNAYRLIKRLFTDWRLLESVVRSDDSQTNFLNALETLRKNLSFPNDEDAIGSAMALVRLQETYKLDISQMASGILNGIKYGSSMSWMDCFYLAQYLYAAQDFNQTNSWFKKSMEMLMDEEYHDDSVSIEYMELVVGYQQEMGDFEAALQLVNQIISLDPTRENLYETKVYLEQMIASGVKEGRLHEPVVPHRQYHLTNEYKLYKQVCRTELSLTPTQKRNLHCKFFTNNVPYRLLQPFKMEIHYLDPYIVQFHDIIRDKEIEVVKRLAKKNMTRSLVGSEEGFDATSAFRISKNAWLKYENNRNLMKMLRHVKHISGLNVSYAEDLQVANYGIGGHYEPHWDFFPTEVSYAPEDGNRVATTIYYLSDVEEGGGTAFPFLNVLVKPIKGSALFWYNLHSSEDPDYRTKHAACPVIKGSKWIANVWVRIRNQDRQRPCELKRNHEISLMYKDDN